MRRSGGDAWRGAVAEGRVRGTSGVLVDVSVGECESCSGGGRRLQDSARDSSSAARLGSAAQRLSSAQLGSDSIQSAVDQHCQDDSSEHQRQQREITHTRSRSRRSRPNSPIEVTHDRIGSVDTRSRGSKAAAAAAAAASAASPRARLIQSTAACTAISPALSSSFPVMRSLHAFLLLLLGLIVAIGSAAAGAVSTDSNLASPASADTAADVSSASAASSDSALSCASIDSYLLAHSASGE